MALLISSVVFGTLIHTMFQKRSSQNIAHIKSINICSIHTSIPNVVEITDYGNSYLSSRCGQANLLAGERTEKLAGRGGAGAWYSLTACQFLPNDLTTHYSYIHVSQKCGGGLMGSWPDNKTFSMISVVKNQLIVARLTSNWGLDMGISIPSSPSKAGWPQQTTCQFVPQFPSK